MGWVQRLLVPNCSPSNLLRYSLGLVGHPVTLGQLLLFAGEWQPDPWWEHRWQRRNQGCLFGSVFCCVIILSLLLRVSFCSDCMKNLTLPARKKLSPQKKQQKSTNKQTNKEEDRENILREQPNQLFWFCFLQKCFSAVASLGVLTVDEFCWRTSPSDTVAYGSTFVLSPCTTFSHCTFFPSSLSSFFCLLSFSSFCILFSSFFLSLLWHFLIKVLYIF